MKYMKWTDLKPGDTVVINPEFLQECNNKFGRLPRFANLNFMGEIITFRNQSFVVQGIKFEGGYYRVTVSNYELNEIINPRITKEGKLWKFPDGPELYNIVSLAED